MIQMVETGFLPACAKEPRAYLVRGWGGSKASMPTGLRSASAHALRVLRFGQDTKTLLDNLSQSAGPGQVQGRGQADW